MTLLHEFGHAIGLRHSDNDDDVMYVQLIEDKRPILSIGDVWAAQRFYGSFRVGERKVFS
jgi:predicted Zn-dependent protease